MACKSGISEISWNLKILICGVLILHIGEGVMAYFTISPQGIVFSGQNPTSEMNFTCTPNTMGMDYVLGFEIGKESADGTKSSIIKQHVPGPVRTGNARSDGMGGRSSDAFFVQGNTGYLKYYLSELRCSDLGTYYCASKLTSSGNDVTSTVAVTETARVANGQDGIRMTVQPEREAYDVNTDVKFVCSGVIGKTFDQDMLEHWVWERKENKKWTEFLKSDERITLSDPTPATNCTFHSTLTYKLQSTDHGREFRCYLKDKKYGASSSISIVGMVGAGSTTETSIAVLATSVMLVMIFRP